MTKTEFIRESIRDKIRKLEEKEITEDKDMMNQIISSERNIKKGKIKELKHCVRQWKRPKLVEQK